MKSYYSIFLLLLLLSCKKDSESIGPCGTTKPLEELPWLRKRIEEVYSPSPDVGYACFSVIFKKQRVFWFYSPFRFPDTTFWTCDGTVLVLPYISEQDEEERNLMLISTSSKEYCKYLIWSSPAYNKQSICP